MVPTPPAAPAAAPVICEPFDLDAGFVDDFGSITRTWTPTALGDYSFEFAGGFFEPDDTGMLQVGTAGIVDNVFDGSGSLISQATPSQSLVLTVTELVEHTFTFTAAGTTAFNEVDSMTAIATSCPAESLDLSAYRNVATDDLVADSSHEHDFQLHGQTFENLGSFRMRSYRDAAGNNGGGIVLQSIADDGSSQAAVGLTAGQPGQPGSGGTAALTIDDVNGDQNSISVGVNGVRIRKQFGTPSTLTIQSLPVFADNAAALAGGLFPDDAYRTDGTGALAVAGVVMVVI